MSRELTVTFAVSDELQTLLDQVMAAGVYPSVNHAVASAMEAFQVDWWMQAWTDAEKDDLRASLKETERERLAGGGVDADQVFEELLAGLDRRYPEAAE